MTESLNQWVNRLSHKPLPVMLRTRTRVRDLLNRSSASHTALSEVIEFDPGFTLRIFQRLKTLPHQPKEPITKISTALPLMGMGLIEQAAQGLPTLEDKLKGPPRRGMIDCFSRAAHAAIYAKNLAERKRYKEPKAFASAALLYDIGEMALWSEAPDTMRRIRQLEEQGSGREEAALQTLGFTLEALNQNLGQKWLLPELTQLSQNLSNSFQPKPLTVMLASAIARTSASPLQNREKLENLELLAEFLETSQAKAQTEFHRLAAKAARKLQVLPLPLPAFSLIQTPQAAATPSPSQAENKLQATPKAAGGENQTTPVPAAETHNKPVAASTDKAIPASGENQTTQTPAVKIQNKPVAASTDKPIPVSDEKQSTQVPAAKTQNKPVAANTDKAKPASNPLHENLSLTIKQMQAQHELHNVMFAMLSPDKKQLQARLVIEQEETARLKGLSINMQEPSLFTALMKKPQAIWLNSENMAKYQPLIPEPINQSLCGQGFMIMSIFVRNRPIGLFYADKGSDSNDLTSDQYSQFKVLCQDFMKNLG